MIEKVMSRRPSLGAVMGFLALVVALGGVATVEPNRTVIKRGDIAPGAVTAKTLAKGAVRAKAISRGAVNRANSPTARSTREFLPKAR